MKELERSNAQQNARITEMERDIAQRDARISELTARIAVPKLTQPDGLTVQDLPFMHASPSSNQNNLVARSGDFGDCSSSAGHGFQDLFTPTKDFRGFVSRPLYDGLEILLTKEPVFRRPIMSIGILAQPPYPEVLLTSPKLPLNLPKQRTVPPPMCFSRRVTIIYISIGLAIYLAKSESPAMTMTSTSFICLQKNEIVVLTFPPIEYCFLCSTLSRLGVWK
jgi:hypothetical protein